MWQGDDTVAVWQAYDDLLLDVGDAIQCDIWLQSGIWRRDMWQAYADLLLDAGDTGEGDGCFAAPQLIESRLLASHLKITFTHSDPDPDPDPDAHRLL